MRAFTKLFNARHETNFACIFVTCIHELQLHELLIACTCTVLWWFCLQCESLSIKSVVHGSFSLLSRLSSIDRVWPTPYSNRA